MKDSLKEQVSEKLSRWSLERVRFLLAHVEDFIDDEAQEMRDRAKNFQAQTGLEKVEDLVLAADPQDPKLPKRVLERLAPFFESGFLVQRTSGNWWVTDIFWRGIAFPIDIKDQTKALGLVPEITPLQVHKASAAKILSSVNLDFISPGLDADAYLLRPTPFTAFVLVSNIGAPWAGPHLIEAQRLINKCFIY